MENLIDNILKETKEAYKENSKNENKIIEEHLLNIMLHTKLLSNQLEIINSKNKKTKRSKEELENLEIEKIKRKIPLWIKNQNQNNYKILKTFMNLSNNNKHTVSTRLLEIHSNLEPKVFLSNYNILKTISQKNHGKIFTENEGQISLWKPIETIVISYFE